MAGKIHQLEHCNYTEGHPVVDSIRSNSTNQKVANTIHLFTKG